MSKRVTQNKNNNIMAEFLTLEEGKSHFGSTGKANAGLTLGRWLCPLVSIIPEDLLG